MAKGSGGAPLDATTLADATAALAAADPDLASIVARWGVPLWDRAPGFPTLVHIILEQQVSLASAQAASIGCSSPPIRSPRARSSP